MYLLCDSTTGQVLHAQPAQPVAGSGQIVVQVADTAPNVAACLSDPTAYWWNGSAVVPWPAWTLVQTSASGTVTVTATLANTNPAPSGWTAPTSGTATIGQTTITLPITSGTMTLAVQVHPSLTNYAVPIQFTAAGTVAATALLGSGDPPPVGIQAIAPTTSGNPYLIAPAGPGSKGFLRAHHLGLTPETQIEILTAALQNLMIAVSVTNHILSTKIIPALQASSYTPLSLTSAEQAALQSWQQDVVPNLLAYEALLEGSTPIPPYAELQAMAPQVLQALQAYAQDVATLPNLA